MPFATTNVRRTVQGNHNVLVGDWTGLQGDASGTLTVAGGRVWGGEFSNQDADSPKETPLYDVSDPSNGIMTVTVHNHMDVTKGRFKIEYS